MKIDFLLLTLIYTIYEMLIHHIVWFYIHFKHLIFIMSYNFVFIVLLSTVIIIFIIPSLTAQCPYQTRWTTASKQAVCIYTRSTQPFILSGSINE